MLGAIAGDMIGSPYEADPIKTTEFPLFGLESRFTDDTVLTVATAFAIMSDGDYAAAYKIFGRMYPLAGYGLMFRQWLARDDSRPYDSWGNGSAMRVCPVGFAFDTEEQILAEARRSAECTHNHPEGIKGAQATALAVHLAHRSADREEIRTEISRRFGYDLNRSVADIRPHYQFDPSCQGTVPEALVAFLESRDFEDSIRLAVSLGGDSDTLACITGSVAHAHYKIVPDDILSELQERLPPDLREIVDEFCAKYSL
jgi:ADP-ribosylglycohydrolase